MDFSSRSPLLCNAVAVADNDNDVLVDEAKAEAEAALFAVDVMAEDRAGADPCLGVRRGVTGLEGGRGRPSWASHE